MRGGMLPGGAIRTAVSLAWLCCVSCTPLNDRARDEADAATGDRTLAAAGDRCEDAADCFATSQCSTASCQQGRCVVIRLEEGASLGPDVQIEGDCRDLVCDEKGRVHSENDDADQPEGDGNPCHDVKCEGGALRTTDMADGSPCNVTGTCKAGTCSMCIEGGVCPRANDCTVFRWSCKTGAGECEDTGELREGRACEQGKVCSGGSCIPCVVGGECDVALLCHTGRRKSCSGAMTCEPEPISGMPCGNDAMGRALYCSRGECTLPCREGPCMDSTDPCQTSHWDCSMPDTPPTCVPVAAADGTSCDQASHCRDGACVPSALLNGDFHDGLSGWTATGDAPQFPIATASNNFDRLAVSTTNGGADGAAQGTISQAFVVPRDAIALRFNVSGGHSHVRLKDESGAVIQECVADETVDMWNPVSWELVSRRGQRVTIAIEDAEVNNALAFIRTTGFDVIREVEAPLRNSQFARGLEGWETSGDGQYFNVFNDYCWNVDERYGRRDSVSTYSRATGGTTALGTETLGVVSQSFVVPMDAVAIRFNVHGGSEARVRLYEGSTPLYTVSALDSDYFKMPVSWDLQPYRGKPLRLAFEDDVTSVPYGYIGVSGFDVITSFNGP